jgi:C-terminal processing protease CtpA/Prc
MLRKTLSSVIAIACAAQVAGAQVTPAGDTRPVGLQADALQADFAVLRNALEEAHGALYRWVSKPDLDRRFDTYRARLTQPMTRVEFFGFLNEVMGPIGDGHNRLEPDDSTAAAFNRALVLPMRVFVESNRLVITEDDIKGDTTLVPGTEITRINGHTAAEITAAIFPRMSRDGFIETGRRSRLSGNFVMSYMTLFDQSSQFTIEGRRANGQTVRVTAQGIKGSDRVRVTNPVNAAFRDSVRDFDPARENVSLRFVGNDVPLLRIHGFGGDRFNAEVDSVMAIVRDTKAGAMILDLRGNGGGVDMYGARLVSRFADKPFRYFDHIRLSTIKPSFAAWKASTFDDVRNGTTPDTGRTFLVTPKLHPGVAEQQPAENPFLGKLIVLIDGGTFSTSADVTALLRSMDRATFIGEETGGAYAGNTSGLNADVRLPNSGFRLRVQMYGYVNAVRPAEKGRGTLPDVPIELRVDDILRGRDLVLERALAVVAASH